MLNNFDVYKLRLISELAKNESISKTSQSLGVTPSAVSQTVKNLESNLRRQLFIRVGKKLKPTPFTEEICKATQNFFADLSILLGQKVGAVEEISIAAPVIFGGSTLVDLLSEFSKIRPDVRFVVRLAATHDLIPPLLDGKFDFAFLDEGPHLRSFLDIAYEGFFSNDLALCCSMNFFKSHFKNKSFKVDVLKELPHVPSHKGKEGVYKWYHFHYGRVPEIKFSMAINSPHGVLRAIQKDCGLGVLPEPMIAEFVKAGSIKIIPGKKTHFASGILLAQLKGKIPSKTEKQLIQFLKIKSQGLASVTGSK
ncbi:MAG: LysR family transcriptional regulator [Pseudobdellovibrionaceae bacterium]